MEIKRINGKWTVNGKMYQDLSFEEQNNLNNFIDYMKEAYLVLNKKKKTEMEILIERFVSSLFVLALIFFILMVVIKTISK